MIEYVLLLPEAQLPGIEQYKPFKAVLVLDRAVSDVSRKEISCWLVNSGCYYVMAWGQGCASWESVIDEANLELYKDILVPDDGLVMTTHHVGEALQSVFTFCKNFAGHDCYDLRNVLIIHIADSDNKRKLLRAYEEA
ncbi:MAG: hypothetical protein K8I00_03010 [Candidatus Omnitrophica bacterium]|nr:hypothetical protein [Candidatus Omnitrophota bacterium]